jgi:hypothetical protein
MGEYTPEMGIVDVVGQSWQSPSPKADRAPFIDHYPVMAMQNGTIGDDGHQG